ncbi:F0F1 ATP synthase subunit epsilon [Marinospirillum alkaliphilum]|uniref:ATP synthase epsilon chain n=1 Tax=Marinospirillum alkaliphilum DSM 21637 TaxID=1122209 RepID=A0A1K1WS29_9GAMM|nr:F0F1 ATP synthase subunit epsilon [Marinospirillum alkaliphilum]SFX40202.1 F-type H+-transporting ATPase subunit epsilon [Marinospirillum alkaliphilum DSM 21637]
MAMTMHCNVVSAEKKLFDGRAELVVASGIMGELGILPGHTPLLTELKPGSIKVVKQNGEEELIYVSSGFLEVQPDTVTVLADSAERAANLDEAAAKEAIEAAQRAMADQSAELEYAQAAAMLAQAAAQLQTIQQLRKKLGK